MSQTKADYEDDVAYDESLDELPTDEELDTAVENLEARGFDVVVVEDETEALDEVVSRIPEGASVMNGHSTTLEEVGFVEHLSGSDHGWEDLHADILAADDEAEAARLRRESQAADYFLGSVNAIARTGELVAADASGSRVGAYPFAAGNLLLVSGANKVVEDLETARERVRDVVYPLEDARAQDAYGVGSVVGKEFVYHHENTEGRTTLVLIRDRLGY